MLDMSRVAGQIDAMIHQLKSGWSERQASLERALNLLGDESIDLKRLQRKTALSKSTFLVAGLVDEINGRHLPPALPAAHSIIATDGSQIGTDRHQATRCFLINIGRVRLDYGDKPAAELSSLPQLYAGETDCVIACGARQQVIDANLLGIKRAVEEARHLAEMAAEIPAGRSALALLDGSLIMWSLASKDIQDFVVEEMLEKGFLKHLAEIQRLSQSRDLALASYISFPRSTDVVNTLRLLLCPNETVDCDRQCRDVVPGKRACDAVAGVQDSDLFQQLEDGQRSSLFISSSKIVASRYGAQRVYFFYLRCGDEIARVEIPEWVAADSARLGLTHTLVLDQCRRGQGYPVALSEAHEQAVVTGADSDNFRRLLESWLGDEHLPVLSSAKSNSKRTRWV
jgi:hypothetical protein